MDMGDLATKKDVFMYFITIHEASTFKYIDKCYGILKQLFFGSKA